uniref:Uncharacterized protein n=1 Tax=viral metagenome TaxID=1070528 RepID=A0A6C0H8V9_9ZZZZ
MIEEFSFDDEMNININNILASLNNTENKSETKSETKSEKNTIILDNNIIDFTKKLESELESYHEQPQRPKNKTITNVSSIFNKLNQKIQNNNYKEILIYTLIFFLINLNKIPFINNIKNNYFNLIIKTTLFFITLLILKKYYIKNK